MEKIQTENVNCETSLTRNENFLGLLTSVFSYSPMQSRYRDIDSIFGSHVSKRVCTPKYVEQAKLKFSPEGRG